MKKIERIIDKVIIAIVYLITITLAVLLLMSCEEEHQSKKIVDDYKIVVIDSCEYIRGTYQVAHKGNCRYCTERNKKLIREQVDSVLIDIYD